MGEHTAVQIVAGLLHRDGQVLLCHRRPDRDHYPDVWDLPGGHIEEGESESTALARELREELGITIHQVGDKPWRTLSVEGLVFHIYLVGRWTGEPRNVATDEHDEMRWVGVDELPRLALADSAYVEILKSALS